jgi:hypothetical protein
MPMNVMDNSEYDGEQAAIVRNSTDEDGGAALLLQRLLRHVDL